MVPYGGQMVDELLDFNEAAERTRRACLNPVYPGLKLGLPEDPTTWTLEQKRQAWRAVLGGALRYVAPNFSWDYRFTMLAVLETYPF